MSERHSPLLPMPNGGNNKFDELKFAQAFMRKAPAIFCKGEEWFAYDGKCWRPRVKDAFKKMSMDVLPPTQRSARHGKAVMEHVEMTRQMTEDLEFRSAVAWDGNSVLVNVANGVLRVTADSISIEPHSKDLMFTGCLGAQWEESGSAPLFAKVLRETLHDHRDIGLFQWFSGYCLFPDCKQHEVFLICYGPGGTGKSTLADAIVHAFSDDVLVTRLSLAQICSSGPGSYSLPSIKTALVNLGTELDTVEMDESSNFKQIVSGEPIVARSIYGKPFKMETTCKLWFLSNALPRFKSGTDAEYRRARFLSFSKKPAEKDTTLKDQLRLERNGILAWLVGGLQAILQGIPAPMGSDASMAVLKRFELSNDPVGCFVKEHCEFRPEYDEVKDKVIDAFTQFKFVYKKVDFYLAQSFSRSEYEREGLFKNGYYALDELFEI